MWQEEVERVWAGLSEEVILEVTRWRPEHPRATFKEIEEAVDGSLTKARARLLQEVALASGAREVSGDTEDSRAKCPECGHLLQRRGEFIRRVCTNSAEPIELKRGYGVCPAWQAGIFPLDEELGLLPGFLTPSLVEGMVQLGSRLPFAQAAELMGRFWKVAVSEATVRRATEKSGQAHVEVQREEVAALEQEMQEAPLGPALQQLSVDGAMVPLLHGEWGEVKTLAIGTIEQSGPEREAHARDMSYFSRMLDHGRFGWLATVETHRRGTGNAGTVCAVVDGAEWQQKFIDLHCPEAVRILDWCHAAEYLARAGQAAFGSGTREASEWLGRQLHELKHGGPERLLENLRELGLGLGDGGALKTVKASVEYLEKRRGQIRYAQFQAAGYPIGSGAVESANKLVVEQRLKGAGMHWARANVNPMVALRTVICSGRWEEAWSQISRKLGQQAKKRRMKQDPAEVPAQKGMPTATDATKKLSQNMARHPTRHSRLRGNLGASVSDAGTSGGAS